MENQDQDQDKKDITQREEEARRLEESRAFEQRQMELKAEDNRRDDMKKDDWKKDDWKKEDLQKLEEKKAETLKDPEARKTFESLKEAKDFQADTTKPKADDPKSHDFEKHDGIDHQRNVEQRFGGWDEPIKSEQERHFWETHQYHPTKGFQMKEGATYDPHKFGPLNDVEKTRREGMSETRKELSPQEEKKMLEPVDLKQEQERQAEGVKDMQRQAQAAKPTSRKPDTDDDWGDPKDHPGMKMQESYIRAGMIKPENAPCGTPEQQAEQMERIRKNDDQRKPKNDGPRAY